MTQHLHHQAAALVERIHSRFKAIDRPLVQIMEVCGTHTVSLFRSGVKSLLPFGLELISGPGCPVCVTSQGYLDTACELANRPEVTLCTYGDMMRVPGSMGSLEQMRAGGNRIRIVYSARDALQYAVEHPDQTIVFLAVGFETTTPATAATVIEATRRKISNYKILAGHRLVIPAMQALLHEGEVPIDGFLCPGHVSVVIGSDAYEPVVSKHRKPCVVAGFEPINMLDAIVHLLDQIHDGRPRVENVYTVAVSQQGNPIARQLIDEVFEPADTLWRAMGSIPASGLELRPPYRHCDALDHFQVELGPDVKPPGCLCGLVIQGKVKPIECSLFARSCTPVNPVGPCMVSSEGTCAAWYKYRRHELMDTEQVTI